jgi:hypothetical protein
MRPRFTIEEAAAWQRKVGWLVGCNYVPAYAVNQLDTWAKETFDPAVIDRELGMAESLGFNAVRIFLHFFHVKYAPDVFYANLDRFLDIAARHGISAMPVFYTGGFNSYPQWGPQPDPVRGIHNSRWVQSPGAEYLGDTARHPELDPYVQGTIARYRGDDRICCWDLFNEPTCIRPNEALKDKREKSLALAERTFRIAREADPTQPLTVDCVFRGCGHAQQHTDPANPTGGVDHGDEFELLSQSPIAQLALRESDVNSFHYYGPLDYLPHYINGLKKHDRPILCTEWMARVIPEQNFMLMLPEFKKHHVHSFSFGLVSGRTNFIHCALFPPERLNARGEPDVWYHDIFRQDGTPFSHAEVAAIRRITGKE